MKMLFPRPLLSLPLLLPSVFYATVEPSMAYEKRMEVPLAAIGKASPVEVQLLRLISKTGEEERFEAIPNVAALGISVSESEKSLSADTRKLTYTLKNSSSESVFVKLVIRAKNPFQKSAWWNGYANQVTQKFEADHLMSQWFPVNAVLSNGKAFFIGLDPMEVFSRVESTRNAKLDTLDIEIPLILDANSDRTASFVVAACKARYGYRDIVQHYYNSFPEAYLPKKGISPQVISSQSTYLFWKPENYNQDITYDMIRRFTGGYGGWEWCYKPFIRGGDWAITEKYSVGFKNTSKARILETKEKLNKRFSEASKLDVAGMYYLNVIWSEKTLMEEYFPEALANPTNVKSWGGEAVRGLYPWKNRYADLFVQSIKDIAVEYPESRGIGWDSTFGHIKIPDSVAGVKETVEKSYYQGNVYALDGVGITHLLDVNHSLKSDGYQRANAVNLKLVAPYFIGVRADSGLYEGTPVEDPKRLIRFELLRARLGSPKVLSWHKHLSPDRLAWINWGALTAEETVEAYRQVHDDALFLSYYWGGVPSPGMPTLGVQRTFEAVPELIELCKLGWQPSSGVDHPEGILMARYGDGAGAKLVVINHQFDGQTPELFLPADYWGGKSPLLVRRDGKPLKATVSKEGTRVSLETPSRSVTVLEVMGLAGGVQAATDVTATSETIPGKMAQWRFDVANSKGWDCHFAIPEGYRAPEANGKSLGDSVKVNSGLLTITAQPDISSDLTVDQLAGMNWFPKDGYKGVVVQNGPGVESWEPQRVAGWFEAYSTHVFKTEFSPEVTSDSSAEGLKIQLEVRPVGARKGEISSKGDVVTVAAANEESLKATTLYFLHLMDKAFPYYGILKAGKKDTVMTGAGLVDTVLTPVAKNDFILKPTLDERMKKAFRPLAVE